MYYVLKWGTLYIRTSSCGCWSEEQIRFGVTNKLQECLREVKDASYTGGAYCKHQGCLLFMSLLGRLPSSTFSVSGYLVSSRATAFKSQCWALRWYRNRVRTIQIRALLVQCCPLCPLRPLWQVLCFFPLLCRTSFLCSSPPHPQLATWGTGTGKLENTLPTGAQVNWAWGHREHFCKEKAALWWNCETGA